MDLTSMPWGSFRGPACILWWIYKCSGELPRVPRRPHASTQRRRRVAAVQACLGRCSKRLRAASAPNAATHPPHEHDSLAEWSKALASGASPKGRGFEPHSCHLGALAARCRPVANRRREPAQDNGRRPSEKLCRSKCFTSGGVGKRLLRHSIAAGCPTRRS